MRPVGAGVGMMCEERGRCGIVDDKDRRGVAAQARGESTIVVGIYALSCPFSWLGLPWGRVPWRVRRLVLRSVSGHHHDNTIMRIQQGLALLRRPAETPLKTPAVRQGGLLRPDSAACPTEGCRRAGWREVSRLSEGLHPTDVRPSLPPCRDWGGIQRDCSECITGINARIDPRPLCANQHVLCFVVPGFRMMCGMPPIGCQVMAIVERWEGRPAMEGSGVGVAA
jgi:hypothetical protein